MLIISKISENYLKTILSKVKNKKILTISDQKGFAEKGVMLHFINQKNKVKFELNRASLNNSGLSASSELLKLAILVNGED